MYACRCGNIDIGSRIDLCHKKMRRCENDGALAVWPRCVEGCEIRVDDPVLVCVSVVDQGFRLHCRRCCMAAVVSVCDGNKACVKTFQCVDKDMKGLPTLLETFPVRLRSFVSVSPKNGGRDRSSEQEDMDGFEEFARLDKSVFPNVGGLGFWALDHAVMRSGL